MRLRLSRNYLKTKLQVNLIYGQRQKHLYKMVANYTEETGFPGGTSGKEPACQCRLHKESQVRSLGRGWQPTPVFLPGKISWTEEPGGLHSLGSQTVRHDWRGLAQHAQIQKHLFLNRVICHAAPSIWDSTHNAQGPGLTLVRELDPTLTQLRPNKEMIVFNKSVMNKGRVEFIPTSLGTEDKMVRRHHPLNGPEFE